MDGAELPEEVGVTEFMITAAEDLRDRHYPDARALEPLVDILCEGLLDSVGPETTSRIVAALVHRLEDEIGSRVFAAYIQSVGQ